MFESKSISRHKKSTQLVDILEETHSKEEELLTYYRPDKELTLTEVFKSSFKLGYTSFGGQIIHQEMLRTYFVTDNEYFTDNEFDYVLTLCRVLPGYSSTQLLATLATIKTQSVVGGLVAFIGFTLPSLIVILILSSLIKIIRADIYSGIQVAPDTLYFHMNNSPFLFCLMIISSGVSHAALAILISSTVNIANKISNSHFQLLLLIWAAIMYYFFNNYVFILVFILICGVISIFKIDQHYLLDQAMVKINLSKNRMLGLPSLLLLIAIYLIVSLLDIIYPSTQKFKFSDSFLRIGALSFGEGHVVVPFIMTEYTDNKLMEEADVLNGYALVSLLPGPSFNVAAYVGVIVDDVFSGIVSSISIVLPGILLAFAALPYIDKLKNSQRFQYFLRGAASAALGFVFTASFILWIDSCYVNPYSDDILGTINVILCFSLSYYKQVYKLKVLITGAVFLLVFELLKYYIII
jgi:chromate transporter